mmetsp:Transcript_45242/g.102138  ORF Transcript_45242/g.102138 Transcript_45242/m.102138 type:complete len:210 (-) Transcript_45242:74-703(-)
MRRASLTRVGMSRGCAMSSLSSSNPIPRGTLWLWISLKAAAALSTAQEPGAAQSTAQLRPMVSTHSSPCARAVMCCASGFPPNVAARRKSNRFQPAVAVAAAMRMPPPGHTRRSVMASVRSMEARGGVRCARRQLRSACASSQIRRTSNECKEASPQHEGRGRRRSGSVQQGKQRRPLQPQRAAHKQFNHELWEVIVKCINARVYTVHA